MNLEQRNKTELTIEIIFDLFMVLTVGYVASNNHYSFLPCAIEVFFIGFLISALWELTTLGRRKGKGAPSSASIGKDNSKNG